MIKFNGAKIMFFYVETRKKTLIFFADSTPRFNLIIFPFNPKPRRGWH